MRTIFHDFSEELFCFHQIFRDEPGAEYKLEGTRHFHEHYELCVAVSENLELISENGILRPTTPCILLYAPYSFHNSFLTNSSPYECYVFHFRDSFAQSFDPRYFDVTQIYRDPMTVLPADTFQEELFAILKLWKDGDAYVNLRRLILALLLELIQRHLSSAIGVENTDRGRLNYIFRISSYINEHFHEPLTAEMLSREFYVSRQKLDADFKRVMRTTLKQYILDVRTVNAVRMLSLGKKSVDVAYACGFVSESHFIRTFSQRIGMPPTRFSKNTGVVSDWDSDLKPIREQAPSDAEEKPNS